MSSSTNSRIDELKAISKNITENIVISCIKYEGLVFTARVANNSQHTIILSLVLRELNPHLDNVFRGDNNVAFINTNRKKHKPVELEPGDSAEIRNEFNKKYSEPEASHHYLYLEVKEKKEDRLISRVLLRMTRKELDHLAYYQYYLEQTQYQLYLLQPYDSQDIKLSNTKPIRVIPHNCTVSKKTK